MMESINLKENNKVVEKRRHVLKMHLSSLRPEKPKDFIHPIP